jgi:hypothetical protein
MFGTSAAVRQQCRRVPHLTCTRTCSSTPAGSNSPTRATTPWALQHYSGTKHPLYGALQRLCGRELEESVRERARPLLPRRGPWRSISDS